MYVEKDEKKTFRMFQRLHQVYVVLSKYKIRIVKSRGINNNVNCIKKNNDITYAESQSMK